MWRGRSGRGRGLAGLGLSGTELKCWGRPMVGWRGGGREASRLGRGSSFGRRAGEGAEAL